MMMHANANSESDVTSLAPSSPKRPLYYVQSPSHDGDKSSSIQPTTTTTPMDSPSHPSTLARHSSASTSASNNKGGWSVIREEGDFDHGYGYGYGPCHLLVAIIMGSLMLFAMCCFIIWGATRPYKPQVSLKSLTVNNFYSGEGSDFSGVPTKLLTVNCSVKMIIYNPATFFGIHVSSDPVNLMFSEIKIASGQLKKYYQPRKSWRTVSVIIEGHGVPLYGAGATLAELDNSGGIPLKLESDIKSWGEVVGKLVKTKHHQHIYCSLVIDSSNTEAIKFGENPCT